MPKEQPEKKDADFLATRVELQYKIRKDVAVDLHIKLIDGHRFLPVLFYDEPGAGFWRIIPDDDRTAGEASWRLGPLDRNWEAPTQSLPGFEAQQTPVRRTLEAPPPYDPSAWFWLNPRVASMTGEPEPDFDISVVVRQGSQEVRPSKGSSRFALGGGKVSLENYVYIQFAFE